MTLKETTKPTHSRKCGLPAIETHNVGRGTLVGQEVQGEVTFATEMRPDGYWKGHCPAGVIRCGVGVATFTCNGVGNINETGGVMFHGVASFGTTSEALSELNDNYYMFS